MTTQKRAVVTGGAGFIGSHLSDALIKDGWAVAIIDNLIAGKKENVPPGATLHVLDILETDKILPIITGADVVFHLAALPKVQLSIDEPTVAHAANLSGVVSVLDAARRGGAGRVVFASSAAVYGDHETLPLSEDLSPRPIMPYALQKYAGEEYCRIFAHLYGLKTVSLRFFNVYGPRMDPTGAYALVVGKWLALKKEGKPLPVTGDGSQTRDFIHVFDIVRAIVLAGTAEGVGTGEVMNIGSGKETTLRELATLFGGETETIPARVENQRSVAAVSRVKELLGWEPRVSLPEGIRGLMAESES
jgi:UDP-glucose 4-epimerase